MANKNAQDAPVFLPNLVPHLFAPRKTRRRPHPQQQRPSPTKMSNVQKDHDSRSGASDSPMSIYHPSKSQETGKSGSKGYPLLSRVIPSDMLLSVILARTPDSEATDSFSHEAFLRAELDAHFSNAREEIWSMMLEERAVLAKERAETQAMLVCELDKFSSRMLERMITLVAMERAEARAAERHEKESGA
ncbi:unnamed protein product [Cyclocybe aegerita]|uniref:Uncharacterized protein n=1 Tax=Cyclocybe aegerita TaxID=1973307 RepID=A0A8S0W0Q7_CYCAE|nr:unnamed protein product [Cyclocybe aegerita]